MPAEQALERLGLEAEDFDVEVFRRLAEQRVAHRSADQQRTAAGCRHFATDHLLGPA